MSSFVKKFLGLSDGLDIPYQFILDRISESIVLMDSSGKIIFCNAGFCKLVCVDNISCILGRKLVDFYAAANPVKEYDNLLNSINSDGVFDFSIRTINGTLVLTQAKLENFSLDRQLMIFKDSSKQRERENQLIREAKSDKLTHLFNRKGFEERLLAVTKKDDDSKIDSIEKNKFKVGILFIDLDEFKPINDTYGHDAGDLILISVANNLASSITEYETAARIGGDEFVCIFPICESKDELLIKGKEILNAIAKPVEIDNHTLVVKCSIGGALMSEECNTSTDLLKKADNAMYKAKRLGKNSVIID